ncbi:TetR/AcrR family transcriptional regulator, partial [Plantactinospora sp. S1510]
MTESETGLRTRLIEVGVDLVTREGTSALSLREIARRAGVSHGAPRRYFPTHLALLSAIARRGFADLTVAITEEIARAEPTPRGHLAALGRVYLDFARSNPGMFDLMFRHDLLESNHLGLRETALPLFDLLVDLVARVRVGGSAPPPVVAAALWANLHGVAQLWGWGSLQLATGT